jgi:hypothetical protein
MVLEVSRWPLTAEARVRARVGPCRIYDWQSGIRESFSPSFSVFLCQYHSMMVFILLYHLGRSRVSSGSIVSDYGLDDRAIGVRSQAEAKDFSSSLCVQTGSGAHPASCTMGTGGPFPGGKSAAGT